MSAYSVENPPANTQEWINFGVNAADPNKRFLAPLPVEHVNPVISIFRPKTLMFSENRVKTTFSNSSRIKGSDVTIVVRSQDPKPTDTQQTALYGVAVQGGEDPRNARLYFQPIQGINPEGAAYTFTHTHYGPDTTFRYWVPTHPVDLSLLRGEAVADILHTSVLAASRLAQYKTLWYGFYERAGTFLSPEARRAITSALEKTYK